MTIVGKKIAIKYVREMTMTEINKDEMRQKLGNISQIRELLFGEQMKEYDLLFEQSKQKIQQIESSVDDLSCDLEHFKSDIKEHLTQFKDSLGEEISLAVDSLEKKIKYLSVNTYTEVNKIHHEIDIKTQANYQKIELVIDRLNSRLQSIRQEAENNKEILNKDIQHLKKQLSETIENNLTELTEAKVSRSDLAEVLFELCLKVKGQDASNYILESKENGDRVSNNDDNDSHQENIKGELIVLEEN